MNCNNTMLNIALATKNSGKLEELKKIIPSSISLHLASEYGLNTEFPEDGLSLETDAIGKARLLYAQSKIPSIADDTGLEIEALCKNGLLLPGTKSAEYSGSRDSLKNMEKVLFELKDLKDLSSRKAHFRTIIAMEDSFGTHLFEGVVEGHILLEPRGEKGFGYDPIFQPLGYDKSFAELSLEIKNEISHRAIATKKWLKYINHFSFTTK